MIHVASTHVCPGRTNVVNHSGEPQLVVVSGPSFTCGKLQDIACFRLIYFSVCQKIDLNLLHLLICGLLQRLLEENVLRLTWTTCGAKKTMVSIPKHAPSKANWLPLASTMCKLLKWLISASFYDDLV